MGQQSPLKALLNQQEPEHIARNLRYHRYVLQARAQKMKDYQRILEKMNALELALEKTLQELRQQQNMLAQQQQLLTEQRNARERALRALRGELQTKDGALRKLKRDRDALAAVIKAARSSMSRLPAPRDFQAFSKSVGRLSWPVKGSIKNRFGTNRGSGMKWDGVMISLQPDSMVNAIYGGRVVFADWLSGYGLLMIIDHGGGYMSLYAHNAVLLREVGEWIQRGDTIARSGNTGTDQQPGLYFEIRYQGQPVDPARWCR